MDRTTEGGSSDGSISRDQTNVETLTMDYTFGEGVAVT